MGFKVLVVFSTQMEAEKSLEALHCKTIEEGRLYQFKQGHLVISGWGILNACGAVFEYAHLANEVWNFGICGSLQDDHQIDQLFPVKSATKYLSFQTKDAHSIKIAEGLFPPIELASEGGRLITSDYPIHDTKLKRQMCTAHDLVDMEGYGIAFAAKQAKKHCRMWKFVSDFCSEGGQHLIKQSMKELSQKTADVLIGLL